MTKYKVLLMHYYLFQQWYNKQPTPTEDMESKIISNLFM